MVRDIVKFTVLGEPASKANQRQIVLDKRTGRPRVIKSQKALDYVNSFTMQCPQLNPPMSGDLKVTITIFYQTRRPDLDESVILDCMQSKKIFRKVPGKKKKEPEVVRPNIYMNDRQVREKHVFWALDPDNPRAEITVEQL